MLRWALGLSIVVACDKGPIQEHRLYYEWLSETRSGVSTAVVDFDKTTLTLHMGPLTTSEQNVGFVTQDVLDSAIVKELADLAACARTEAPGTKISLGSATLTLHGDNTKVITPLSAPCAAKLERRIKTLAAWHEK